MRFLLLFFIKTGFGSAGVVRLLTYFLSCCPNTDEETRSFLPWCTGTVQSACDPHCGKVENHTAECTGSLREPTCQSPARNLQNSRNHYSNNYKLVSHPNSRTTHKGELVLESLTPLVVIYYVNDTDRTGDQRRKPVPENRYHKLT